MPFDYSRRARVIVSQRMKKKSINYLNLQQFIINEQYYFIQIQNSKQLLNISLQKTLNICIYKQFLSFYYSSDKNQLKIVLAIIIKRKKAQNQAVQLIICYLNFQDILYITDFQLYSNKKERARVLILKTNPLQWIFEQSISFKNLKIKIQQSSMACQFINQICTIIKTQYQYVKLTRATFQIDYIIIQILLQTKIKHLLWQLIFYVKLSLIHKQDIYVLHTDFQIIFRIIIKFENCT
ncbi:unnamed protein product [Paramecium sonneborni]|uniref:Uncharacterized protein n=1 Tax=Paramecium sonneborni TaxID=65129 RepID=A0A8S1P480_9CILI|nr:unnamed protein product [Paramecium sonneborni]